MRVWMNGCFDILHYGHFRMINYAASIGGKLVIGIDSDNRIKRMKGDDRPFHNEEQRRFNLMNLNGVYNVVVFDTDEQLRDLIFGYHPNIFVIGSEYKDKYIIGGNHSDTIHYFDKIEGFSTTKILENG
jgi:D-beta-D-heptose 7-phosphate kinase/D-beta-D-heptose 1-phosphate adenosyltransferase